MMKPPRSIAHDTGMLMDVTNLRTGWHYSSSIAPSSTVPCSSPPCERSALPMEYGPALNTTPNFPPLACLAGDGPKGLLTSGQPSDMTTEPRFEFDLPPGVCVHEPFEPSTHNKNWYILAIPTYGVFVRVCKKCRLLYAEITLPSTQIGVNE